MWASGRGTGGSGVKMGMQQGRRIAVTFELTSE